MRFNIEVMYNRRVSSKPHPDGKNKEFSDNYGLDFNIQDYQYHIGRLIQDSDLLGTYFDEIIPFKRWIFETDDASGLRYHTYSLKTALKFEKGLINQNLCDVVSIAKVEF